jgi:hypothetical protein
MFYLRKKLAEETSNVQYIIFLHILGSSFEKTLVFVSGVVKECYLDRLFSCLLLILLVVTFQPIKILRLCTYRGKSHTELKRLFVTIG